MTATKIGCDHVVAANVTEAADGTPTFDNLTPLPGVISLNINPNSSSETLFYDDGPGETATTLGKVEVAFEKNAISSEESSFLLGHQQDTNGCIVHGSTDLPPWRALGFRTLKSNGTYRYVWLYKGKFHDPEDNNQTKGDSVNYNTETLNANFVKLTKDYTINGKVVKPYKIELDEEATAANSATIDKWFQEVILPA